MGLTPEQIEEIKVILATERKAAEADLVKTIAAAMKPGLEAVAARVEAIEKGKADPAAEAKAEADKKAAAAAAAGDPVAARLVELDKFEARLKAQADEREAVAKRATAEAQRKSALSDVRHNMLSAGIAASSIEHAMTWFEQRGGLVLGEDGTASVKTKDRFGNDVSVPIADGVKAWAASEEAKVYRPPPTVQGAGSRPGERPPPVTATGDVDWSALGAQVSPTKLLSSVPVGE
jgi:hypothetical protein